MKRLIRAGYCFGFLFGLLPAHATIVLSDSFSYSDGSLVNVGASLWANHSGTTGQVRVVSGRVLISETNSEDVFANLQDAPYPPTTNILLYARFKINLAKLPSGAGGYFAHFKTSSTSGFADKFYVTTNGVAAGFYRVGLANSSSTGPNVLINSNLSLNTDYYLVTRFAPSNAVGTLWLNPGAETDPGVTAADSPITITATTFALRESLVSGDGMGTIFIDDLVVGTSFSDVSSNPTNIPPSINTQPQSQTVNSGANVQFTVAASGSTPLSYQWQFYSTNLPGATLSSLSLSSVTSNSAGPYSVTITNSAGATNSQIATLTVNPPIVAPSITNQPQDQTVTEGGGAVFTVGATGDPVLTYQWRLNGVNLSGPTDSTLTLSPVSTNQAGSYSVVVTNGGGSVTSSPAILTVIPLPQIAVPAISYVTYNMKGNGASNWSTNAPQVQAIGHELMYLNPDIITFNEIPNAYTYEMTNFITAFLPGYYLATNSATDGFIRSGIASRYPILSSKSYLHSADLNPYGYTNANFTRDLFEAQIAVPNFAQRLHVFVVHLKSGQDADSSSRRSAETAAISNFFVTVFLPTNIDSHPYLLSGDMNEDINDPPSSNPQSIQKLISAPTGLLLTTPVNPYSGSRLTFSIQNTNGLSKRYDYIMPCPLMFSNITSSQVFRTDLLPSPPPPLQSNDDSTASDHLPVQMVFSNPYDKPFRITSFTRSNQNVSIQWQSIPGQPYRVEASSDLSAWTTFRNTATASAYSSSFNTNTSDSVKFVRVYRQP